MTLHDLDSAEAVDNFKSTNTHALVCFSATWCGPCQASKPTLMDLANSYQNNPQSDLVVGIAYEHNLGDAIHNYNVRAFPTYVLFVSGSEVGRIEGVNFDGIRKMVETQGKGCKKSMGEGHSLGGGDHALSAAEARAQRLAKFSQPTAAAAPPEEAQKDADVAMKDADDSKPAAETSKTNEAESKPDEETAAPMDEDAAEPEMVDPTANLSEESLKTLTESMGFSIIRAQKGLLNGNGGTVEGAIEWLLAHQDDGDIDEPIPLVPKATGGGGSAGEPGGTMQSYKCNDCGKVLSNMPNLELHANKTGHSDFEESTEVVKPLTPEEKAAKILEIKALLKAKREEREQSEKVDDIDREKQRRFMGKEMSKTREEMEREARKREAKMRKREKDAAKRERERIRAELAKDKAERQANKGKLKGKLGVDGYNPDAIQYDVGAGGEAAEAAAQEHKHHAAKASAAKIDDYVKKISAYRAGGDGGKCLKILLAYVGNVADKPEEEKFKTIKMDNKVFKTKVKPFVGAKSLLLAVGFAPNDSGDCLVLREDPNIDLLKSTKAKLEVALEKY